MSSQWWFNYIFAMGFQWPVGHETVPKARTAKKEMYSPEFLQFWKNCTAEMRRGGKVAASVAFDKQARLAGGRAELLEKCKVTLPRSIAEMEKRQIDHPEYMQPHASTWLNAGRWDV